MSVQQRDLNISTGATVPTPPTTLITEHEVMLATAAATAATPTLPTASVWQRLRSRRTAERPQRRHYPTRYTFLEHAAMAREMYRL
ncbi:hypothetical protein [Mycolicibacterium thermoresistibile]